MDALEDREADGFLDNATEEPEEHGSNEELLRALCALRRQQLNLKKLFIGMMRSKAHSICTRVGMFFANGGAEKCLEALLTKSSFGSGLRKTVKKTEDMAQALGPF